MFIDVTRYGGLRVMRLAVAAVAYLDACEGGTAIHLLGGETLRVNEDPESIELRCLIALEPAAAPTPEPAMEAPPAAELGAEQEAVTPKRSKKA
jgi:hypothetical protein